MGMPQEVSHGREDVRSVSPAVSPARTSPCKRQSSQAASQRPRMVRRDDGGGIAGRASSGSTCAAPRARTGRTAPEEPRCLDVGDFEGAEAMLQAELESMSAIVRGHTSRLRGRAHFDGPHSEQALIDSGWPETHDDLCQERRGSSGGCGHERDGDLGLQRSASHDSSAGSCSPRGAVPSACGASSVCSCTTATTAPSPPRHRSEDYARGEVPCGSAASATSGGISRRSVALAAVSQCWERYGLGDAATIPPEAAATRSAGSGSRASCATSSSYAPPRSTPSLAAGAACRVSCGGGDAGADAGVGAYGRRAQSSDGGGDLGDGCGVTGYAARSQLLRQQRQQRQQRGAAAECAAVPPSTPPTPAAIVALRAAAAALPTSAPPRDAGTFRASAAASGSSIGDGGVSRPMVSENGFRRSLGGGGAAALAQLLASGRRV